MIKSTCIGPTGVPVLDLLQPHTSAKYVLRNPVWNQHNTATRCSLPF